MIFTLGTEHTFTFRDPAQYPLGNNTELIQAKERSSSGITHIESFEVQINSFTYNFTNMPQVDYNGLIEWFVNVADGMLNTFELTDDYSITRTVRFLKPTLDFTQNSVGLWDGSFSVEEIL
jgi:hypothetical protein